MNNSEQKKYSRDEVQEKTLEYFEGDNLATDVWINKYALKDHEGNIYELTPDDMHHRLAREFARIESTYLSDDPLSEETIYDLLKDFKYIIPQGSPMAGIGNDFQTVSLGNCFVIGNDSDSYGGILKTDQELAHLMKRRGGCGTDISHIRPKGCEVRNAAIISTGVVPFMERYSNSTREISQEGRRGALMISIDVKHNDAEDFIDAKLELKKVTGANVSVKISDEFMNCVINDTPFIQQFPIDSNTPEVRQEISAKKLWKKLIHNSWKSAEPGMLFWDTIIRESPSDCYSDQGFKTITTNPCLVGETKIALADGRTNITIKQLAEEGLDVPVYCIDDSGELKIRTMRNPRITGYNQKILKVTLENGHEIRCTENHKFRLKNGKYCEAKDLRNGMSLEMLTQSFSKRNYITLHYNSSAQQEHRFVFEQMNNTNIKSGDVIHHKDHNPSNNNIDNLQCLTHLNHSLLHGQEMIGKNNPYYKMSEKSRNNFFLSSAHKGNRNGRYINISNDEIVNHITILTKKLGRRISKCEWQNYAKEINIPITLSEYRRNELGSISDLFHSISKKLNLIPEEYSNLDTRILRTYNNSINQGYNTKIIDKIVMVEKHCEYCNNSFWVPFQRRETAFCSMTCVNYYKNKFTDTNTKRTESINKTYSELAKNVKNKQLSIFTELKFNFNRIPLLKEFIDGCKNNKVPYRFNTKNGFKDYDELKNQAADYNHKIVSIEEDGFADVYNGTVDDFHNFFIGEFEELGKTGNKKLRYFNNQNCGEIPLSIADSCRLLCINLYSYVNNPFTPEASFNFGKFENHAYYAQRLMDDLVDLEDEKIQKIIQKVLLDPEPMNVKQIELDLWRQIQESLEKGRRTGLGITAEGDMLAALGLKYGSPEATEIAEKVHQTLAVGSFLSSVNMAKTRGSFGIWNFEKEKDNPFIQRVLAKIEEWYEDDAIPVLNDYKNFGRRNISETTIAPTGCLVKDSVIQTENGEISLDDLFLFFGYNIKDFYGLKNIWLPVDKNINVLNFKGNKNKITKLYWNGLSETRHIKFNNLSEVESTLEHKFLVKLNEKEAIWKKVCELNIGDKILKIN